MCGIAGIAYWDGYFAHNGVIEKTIAAQKHRGPDEQGAWCGDGVALVHNRLTIIDVVSGQQPMLSEDGNFVLIYNGEVYNFIELRAELETLGHSFSTTSDTEVVLKAYVQWGEGCLQRLRGMFAFAVWNRRDKILFLARDRIGIKPLYYYKTSQFIAFGSELQGLLSFQGIPRRIDYEALDYYLHYQYVPNPLSIFEGVKKLPPAHYMLVNGERADAEPECYWEVQFIPDYTLSEEQWLERMEHVIGESVRLHLVSDVPFGVFLSGGIDSSVVAYYMSRHLQEPVKSFTIGFEELAYDEREYAEQVAQSLGSIHHFELIRPDTLTLLDDFLRDLVKHYGEPFADSSAIPTYYVSKMARSEVKMVLSGDGGDELFAGYNTYPNILASLDPSLSSFKRLVARLLGRNIPTTVEMKASQAPYSEALSFHGIYYAYFNDTLRKQLYRPEIADKFLRHDQSGIFYDHFSGSQARECLSALQYLDIKTYLCGDILPKVDIASMMNSLEVRVPLLDHKVVEMASRIPAKFKIVSTANQQLEKKYIFKNFASRLFPPGLFDRPKHGFGVPIDHWFGDVLYERVKSRVLRKDGILYELFRPEAISDLVSGRKTARNNASRLWALLFLQTWAKVYDIKL